MKEEKVQSEQLILPHLVLHLKRFTLIDKFTCFKDSYDVKSPLKVKVVYTKKTCHLKFCQIS